MEISIEERLARLMPWDLAFTFQGQRYATRPLTVGDLVALDAANRGMGLDGLLGLVGSIFEEPKPDLTKMRVEALLLIIQEVVQAGGELAKKNASLLAAPSQPAAPTTSGSGSGP